MKYPPLDGAASRRLMANRSTRHKLSSRDGFVRSKPGLRFAATDIVIRYDLVLNYELAAQRQVFATELRCPGYQRPQIATPNVPSLAPVPISALIARNIVLVLLFIVAVVVPHAWRRQPATSVTGLPLTVQTDGLVWKAPASRSGLNCIPTVTWD
ncbi:hypothetical protein DAEQUDRAFT_755515 [Daedalea quercina L-15889]|uniref:Uncharacterized protein n=1 Tax=Daedalea quercina L-15889 TaxID=1314783 RepID=A0A165SHX7_9APHY|nr:hypothetical protein DAEQUDRAFT_755515 [Daedalea quercina L-15889]